MTLFFNWCQQNIYATSSYGFANSLKSRDMKTAEEKAREYSNSGGIYNEHGERLLYMGYLAGYNEAIRWRDPKELPLIDKIKYPNGNYSDDVICKDIEGTSYIAYYDHDEKKWCFTMEGEDYTIQIAKWRPIE